MALRIKIEKAALAKRAVPARVRRPMPIVYPLVGAFGLVCAVMNAIRSVVLRCMPMPQSPPELNSTKWQRLQMPHGGHA